MDEKELIRITRNSIKAKKSNADILRGFQKRGYKLEYADKILAKAKRPRKILTVLILATIILLSLLVTIYSTFSNQKMDLKNPLSLQSVITGNVIKNNQNSPQKIAGETVPQPSIKVTPEFLTYLLNEIGATSLHKNYLTFQDPIINFNVDNEKFHSIIKKEIKTLNNLNENADIQFNTNKNLIISAMKSKDPKSVLKDSISKGDTEIEIITNKADLFAKGYMNLYDSLK